MHEVGIMVQALDVAIDAAKLERSEKITALKLRIGALAGVVPEALEFAFEVVTRGTIAEGATFAWEEVPVRCRCRPCDIEFSPEGYVYRCPECGEPTSEVVAGRELTVAEIEVEVEEPHE